MDELWRRELQSGSGRGSPWTIEWVARPMMVGMQACGLFFKPRGKAGLSLSLVYFIAVFTLLWANFLRYFETYTYKEVLGPNILQKVFVHFVHGLGAMSILAYIPLSLKSHKLHADFESYYDKYQCWSKSRQISRRKRNLFALVVSVSAIVLQLCVLLLKLHLLLPDSVIIDMHFNGILKVTDGIPVIWQGILLVVVFYNTASVVFTVGFILLLALILAEEFNSHASDMQKLVENHAGLSHNLEYLRLRFRDLSRLTKNVDNAFSVYILIIYVSDILICCFVIYISIYVRMENDFLIQMASTFIPYLLAFLSQLLLLTYGGTVLNHAAHSCKNILYYADLSSQEWTVGFALQYSTFLAELREDRIGLSAWSLFYINQTTVKTVILMITTYSVILLKFGNHEAPQTDQNMLYNVTQSGNPLPQLLNDTVI